MVYTLRAIPDQHPLERFNFLLEQIGLQKPYREIVQTELFRAYIRNPLRVLSRDFWNIFEKHLSSETEDPGKRFVIARELELIRSVYQHQFGILDQHDLKYVYQEGKEKSPFGRYAETKGLEVISLDKDNPFHDDLLNDYDSGIARLPFFASRHQYLQKRREELWVSDKIQVSPELGTAILTAGQDHVQNRFGLADRLQEKGISLHIIPCDYTRLGKQASDYALQKFPPRAMERIFLYINSKEWGVK